MVSVVKKKGQSNEALFKDFNKLSILEKIADEVREGMFYTKPSQVRKEKEKNRNKRHRKNN